MAYADILAGTTIDPAFSPADRKVILGVIKEAYEKSAMAREMFDSWFGAGKTLRIDYGDGRFDAWDGSTTLDLRQLDKASYIDFNGKAVQDFPFTAIIHELGHALKLLPDNWSPLNPAGDNQNYVNTIYKEAGYEQQLAYMAYDASGAILVRNREYTDGIAMDNAWVKKWAFLPNDFDVEEGGQYTQPRKDLIIGSNDDNALMSGGGDDFVYGLGGKDILVGGDGDDRLSGGEGADILDGGEGSDFASYVHAENGVVASLNDYSRNTGDAAGDIYLSIENMIGSAFADRLTGDAGANRLEGRDGNDQLLGGAGNDILEGGAGNDTLRGDQGDDILLGGAGRDLLVGSIGRDQLFGGDGNDQLLGGSSNDLLDGGAGFDMACYLNAFSGYSLATNGDITTVRGVEGLDTLKNIEVLRFLDGTYDVATSQFNAFPASADYLLAA